MSERDEDPIEDDVAATIEPEAPESRGVEGRFSHPLFKGARIRDRSEKPAGYVRDRMYELGEPFFSQFGPDARANGWAVYPQTREGNRRPWLIPGMGSIKIAPFQEAPPPVEDVSFWAAKVPTANVAAVCGPGSGGLVGVDIDVGDPLLCESVQKVAFETLGETRFRRQGRVPRMMLLYRLAAEDFQNVKTTIPNSDFKFATKESADSGGELLASGDQIELLGKGKSVTIYGAHHSTGDYFKWGDLSPTIGHVDDLPLIDREMMEDFILKTAELRPFVNLRSGTSGPKADFEYDPTVGFNVLRKRAGEHTNWVEDANGLVIDGRESFAYWLTKQTIARFPQAFQEVPGEYVEREIRGVPTMVPRLKLDREGPEKFPSIIMSSIVLQFKEMASQSGKWSDGHLKSDIAEKFRRIVERFEERAPGFSLIRDVQSHKNYRQAPRQERPAGSVDPFGYIRKVRDSVSATFEGDPAGLTPPLPNADKSLWAKHEAEVARLTSERERKRKERALIPDRSEIAKDVQDRITAALDQFFAEVYPERDPEEKPATAIERIERAKGARIHVLRAPTGAGKTSRTIAYIATDERTKKYDAAIDSGTETVETKSPGPILFLLPTYNNIAELRERAEFLNLDKDLNDEELGLQAAERGLVAEEDVALRLADLRRNASSAGLRSMVYKGKEAAGCKMVEKLKLLTSAGISSAGLCKAEVRDKDGEKEEKLCVYYNECPAIQQRKEIARSHVVFLAHAFMTLSVPEELKTVRAVVADERIFHLFVHTTTFPAGTFRITRNEPKLTKKEREAVKAGQGNDGQHLLKMRNKAVDIVMAAFQRRECPANALASIKGNALEESGLDLVLAAKRICGGSMPDSSEITPDLNLQQVAAMCDTPVGEKVYEEWRFWKIMEERIMLLREDSTGTAALARELGRDWARMAKGDREMRVQYILHPERNVDGETIQSELIRISWRDTPNWKDAPLLLLDASAETAIIKKIFTTREPKAGGNGYTIVEREVVEHEVPAPLNVKTIAVIDKTYSNASLLYRGEDYREQLNSSKLLTRMRNLLSSASAWYGWGRVVAGANTIVRKAICNDWLTPSNVDFCHFGAMRGLDFAKEHVAAVSFGRMEIPVGTVDGLVAALTYDDDVPEQPFDLLGNGMDPDDPSESLRVPMVPQPMPMRSGVDAMVEIPIYPGEWAKKVQAQYREEELRQFVGRLRPVYREGEAPTWIAASRVIPSGIVVDEVVTLADLLARSKRRDFRIWQASRKADGVLHPKLLLALSPSEFKDEAAVIKEMADLGLDAATGRIDSSKRTSWGFTPVRIQAPDQSIHFAFVRTEFKDPCGHLSVVMERYLDWHIDEYFYEAQAPYKPRVAGRVREPDKVEIELGSRAERAKREQIGLQLLVSDVIPSLPPDAIGDKLSRYPNAKPLDDRAFPMEYPIQVPGSVDTPVRMSLEELNTNRSTRLLDQRMGRIIDETSPAIMDPKQDYSHLSDTVMDNY